MKIVALLLLLTTPSLVCASSIQVADFSHIVDTIEAQLGPARHQHDTELCVGNSVADLLTFHIGQRVSTFSTAVRNFQLRQGPDAVFLNPISVIGSQTSPKSPFMIALASSSLHSSLKASFCPDDQPFSTLWYRDKDLNQLYDTYQTYRAYIGAEPPYALYEKLNSALQKIAPQLLSQDFIQHLSPYKPLYKALGEWFDRQCNLRLSHPSTIKVVGGEAFRLSSDDILAAIDEALSSGTLALIHYDSRVLRGEEPSFWESYIGFHVSSIVATAQSDGDTFYLLRNSWGVRCDHYAPSISERCDRGHIWLTEQEIRTYVTSVSYLKF